MEIVSIVLNGIFASGIVTVLVFYKSKKRKESAIADKTETEAGDASFDLLGKKVDYIDDQLDSAYTQIKGMQALIDDFRGQVINLQKQLSEVQISLIKEKTEHEKTKMKFNELKQKWNSAKEA